MSTVSVCGTLYHTLPSACMCPSSNTHPFYIILLELAFSASLCGLEVEKTVVDITSGLLFRWFKFTLKPPYSIAIGKLRLAIWDTSFWTFWLKFGHKGP